MVNTEKHAPDESAFRQHLAAGPYLAGEAVGRWRVQRIEWPVVLITVQARDGRNFCFRFACEDYPTTAATARVWNLAENQPADFNDFPKGGPRIMAVFRNDWQDGTALYLPTDAVGIKTHPNWRTQYPSMIWRPDRGIVHYLEILHELLNTIDYAAEIAA